MPIQSIFQGAVLNLDDFHPHLPTIEEIDRHQLQKSILRMDHPQKKNQEQVLSCQQHQFGIPETALSWGFPFPWGYPNSWMVDFMENPGKMDDDWGYPHLWKPPCYIHLEQTYPRIAVWIFLKPGSSWSHLATVACLLWPVGATIGHAKFTLL